MASRILSFFKGDSDPDNITTLTKFVADEAKSGGKVQSPKLAVPENMELELPIIGIGGAGCKILSQVVAQINDYGVIHPTLGIDIDGKQLQSYENIKYKLHLETSSSSTSKQYLRGQTIAISNKDKLENSINDYLKNIKNDHNTEIVFLLIGGGGGTALGVSLEIIPILMKNGKRPVPILILPTDEESTRTKFNAAVALYHYSYAPKGRSFNLTTLIFDNQLFFDQNTKKKFSITLENINERISSTIADVFISTAIESSGFSLDLNEFLEIFREVKGIGVFSYYHSEAEGDPTDIWKKVENNSNSLKCDITTGSRSYLFTQTEPRQLSSRQYRNMVSMFSTVDVFPKLSEIAYIPSIAFRGVTTGIQIPQRITEFMDYAQNLRITLLNQEVENAKSGRGNPKIDRLDGNADIEAMDSEEARQARSQEISDKKKRGDQS